MSEAEEKELTVADIVIKFLTDNGYSGLYNGEGCGCSLGNDFMPCGGEFFDECRPGYQAAPPEGSGCDYWIVPEKPENREDKA